MKKTILSLMIFFTFIGFDEVFSQNYVRIFFNEINQTTDDFEYSIVDQVANAKELKFKIKVKNKTNDILLFKPSEVILVVDGKEYKNGDKDLYLDPYESGSRVLNYASVGFLSVREYTLKVDGFYKLPLKEKIINTPEMKLPPEQNEFKTGDFVCTIVNIKKESGETAVKFKCRYDGNDYGVISTNKPSVLMPDGNKYATAKSKENNKVIQKGEEATLTVFWEKMPGGAKMDMQKVPMTIFWNETFSVSKAKKMTSFTEKSTWNEQLTFEKGR